MNKREGDETHTVRMKVEQAGTRQTAGGEARQMEVGRQVWQAGSARRTETKAW